MDTLKYTPQISILGRYGENLVLRGSTQPKKRLIHLLYEPLAPLQLVKYGKGLLSVLAAGRE